mgnify:CR=1 FL=1
MDPRTGGVVGDPEVASDFGVVEFVDNAELQRIALIGR